MPKKHGDRTFQPYRPMEPHLPTMAQCFRDAGYQAYAVGKTHTYPQRDRIGFDDILLDDEGRTLYGVTDDYEIFLGDQGYVGQQFGHGMSNNAYQATAWHLPERLHATNWATDAMARYVRRRDPSRPAFWYLGYRHPHPPLVPSQRFLDHYSDIDINMPFHADWANGGDDLPYNLQGVKSRDVYSEREVKWARRAFYALCTHIDQQIGSLIGTIREEGILDETIIMFTSDHGDMLGDHGLWAKQTFYQGSANIPMIMVGQNNDQAVGFNRVDERLTSLQDVMPTLLNMAGIDIPENIDGRSMLNGEKREYVYGEVGEEGHSSRMIRDQRYKMIWYPVGNHFQLFDLDNDPQEMTDLATDSAYSDTLANMKQHLRSEMYGSDDKWLDGDEIIGEENRKFWPGPNRGLSLTRGNQWPVPPVNTKGDMVFYPESPPQDIA
jgi:arylsulfatase A-like enzyme